MGQAYDVVIIGGGPTGLVLSNQLATEGVSVAVIEKSSANNIRIGENLVPAVKLLFQKSGLWEPFAKLDTKPFYGIHSSWGSNDLIFQPYIFQRDSHGWQVEREQFDAMLLEEAKKSGAKVYSLTELEGIYDRDPKGWQLRCQHNNRTVIFQAKFLIDAGGRKSSISQHLTNQRKPIDRMIGLAVQSSSSEGWERTYRGSLVLESSENGWWYVTGQPDESLITVFMTDADLWENATGHANHWEAWQMELQKTRYIKPVIETDKCFRRIYTFPAFSHLLKEVPKGPWLSVGDALFSRDPLSGQGIRWGMEAALESTPAIMNFLKGDRYAIQKYVRSVQNQYRDYLISRKNYYLMEQRWNNRPFWKRRQKKIDKLLI